MSDAPQGQGAGDAGHEARLEEKLQRVRRLLATFDRVVIAFSGGVDSTFLAHLAREVLGKDSVLTVTADSPSLSREDLAQAGRLAAELGLQHVVIPTKELEDPVYRRNTAARCYICKQGLFEELEELARAQHLSTILYGAIGDDQLTERPGQQAAIERGIRAPLQEAGLEKWEIRELARRRGLPNWDRPQNACLASRIPYGENVTEEKLLQIEQAESFLRAQGFRQVRVRHLGTHARIEVGQEEVARFNDAALCDHIEQQFTRLGFHSVGINRSGYAPGGANQALVDEVFLRAIATC